MPEAFGFGHFYIYWFVKGWNIMSTIAIRLCRPIYFLGKILFKKEGVVWWSYLPYFLFCLIFLYFIAIIINSVMLYKILKSEGMDIGFFEYLFIGSMQFKFFRVLFGIQKISNKFYLKILRINFTVAMIILILWFSVVSYLTYSV